VRLQVRRERPERAHEEAGAAGAAGVVGARAPSRLLPQKESAAWLSRSERRRAQRSGRRALALWYGDQQR
jgi:hypothetical protein